MHYSLPQPLILPMVQAALLEDLGRRADVTSEAVIAAAQTCQLHIVAREQGVLCGIDLARLSFEAMGVGLAFETKVNDGDVLQRGDIIATVQGNARAILSAERTALNFLTHLSGIATTTQQIQASIAYTQAQVTCTRKTMPGLRVLQKFAVRVGGGRNHRLGLDDAILIKDNHIALAGGDLSAVIQQAKAYAGHLIPIEIEVDNLRQLEKVLQEGVSLVLLDNMSVEDLRTAVDMCQGQCQTEASGGLNPDTAVIVAETGVDFLAMGYVTHSARYLDIGMDYLD
ncbi:carboxylating nicotinate-nucleotide diphosphorylase [Vitreoscilla massiliensis]|uniref:nicotinate-nucleotide diphosphorylase (carboxylating) n=1 Tax=Vitreoscilla massiliensis TaxID=1689272 RepID=A0ABY4E0B9_9NEIS|nr:carboxylating nicotinate-nucleotide diphosphorylase [Vitreoscilla massiliensis]UOO88768.1 carboxylating nicotinate-nucleotide diphosphorylase [Vitreoscilla massiliensis]